MRGIHRGPVKSPHKGQVTRKLIPFDDVIMGQMYDIFASLCEQTVVNSQTACEFRHHDTHISNANAMISDCIAMKFTHILNFFLFHAFSSCIQRCGYKMFFFVAADTLRPRRNWSFVRWPVNSPHKGEWRRALVFSLICAWTNVWVNNRDAGDLRRHRAHYDATIMKDVNVLGRDYICQ